MGVSTATISPGMKQPSGLLMTSLCVLFAILYGVFILPNTVFVRNFCLISGAILSLPIIISNRRILYQWRAMPILLIIFLLVWVVIHLFCFSADYPRQYQELVKIWKKIAISIPFALGLGLGLLSYSKNPQQANWYWKIIYIGFLLPAATYFVKFGATYLGNRYGIAIPIFLVLDGDHLGSKFGISRAWYVFFCLPVAAMSIGILLTNLKNKTLTFGKSLAYLLCIPLTLLIFYIENDRLGTFFGFTLIVIAASIFGSSLIQNRSIESLAALLLMLIVSFYISWISFKQSTQWKNIFSDVKVAIEQIDKNSVWRDPYVKIEEWPTNELGRAAYSSNYLRVSWFIAGVDFVIDRPMGYGLLSLSFGELGKERWPEAKMSWSHSAWLDFTLGYGVPGLALFFVAFLLSWLNSKNAVTPWFVIGRWGLPVICAVFLVKEVSSEVFVNAFIFLIVLSSTLSLNSHDFQQEGVI
jgi:hypothetical protein